MARRTMGAGVDSREKDGDFASPKPVALPADGKLLRCTEAARLLGVSKSTLRMMESRSGVGVSSSP